MARRSLLALAGAVGIAAALRPPALLAQDAGASIVLRPAVSAAGSAPAKEAPRTWGTGQVSYYSVPGLSLAPLTTDTTFGSVQPALRYEKNTIALGLQAPLHLPAGAFITFLQLDFYDTSLAGEAQALLEVCTYDGSSCVPQYGIPACGDALVTLCSGTIDAPGYGIVSTDMTSAGIVVDNFLNGYRVVAGTTTNDGSTAIGRVLVGYLLEVSPDPPYASFNDVPTSHPFHQYIEALLTSQITAGCGGNDYCPDAPLTRGQMAVFLAKALGLQWP